MDTKRSLGITLVRFGSFDRLTPATTNLEDGTPLSFRSRRLQVANDERRELFAQVWRDASLETSFLAFVIAFNDLRDFVIDCE